MRERDIVPSMEAILAEARAKVDEQARSHINELKASQLGLDEAVQLHAIGALTDDRLSSLREMADSVLNYPKDKPMLQKAIEKIMAEQAEKTTVEAPKPAAAERIEVVEPAKETVKEEKGKKKFTLGEKEFRGKEAEILEELSKTNKDSLVISDTLARKVWPGVKLSVSRGRLSVYLGDLRKEIKGTDYEIISDYSVAKDMKVGYYLKRPGEVVEEPVFVLPDGRELRGDAAEILNVLSKFTKENPAPKAKLGEELFPKLKKKDRARRVDGRLASARDEISGTGLEIINLTSHGSHAGGKYYLERPETSAPVQPEPKPPVEGAAADAAPEIAEKETQAEFANLSRVDISLIASAVWAHKDELAAILGAVNIKLIEDPIIESLIKVSEETLAIRKISIDERPWFINEARRKALERARKLLESPDFEKTMEGIEKQNSDVWCLLVNLSEMTKIKVSVIDRQNGQRKVMEGLEFLEELLSDENLKTKEFSVIKPEPEEPPQPPAQTESIPEQVKRAFERFIQGPKAVERRDGDIRARLDKFLFDILSRLEFKKPVNQLVINKVFQKLKESVVDSYTREGLIAGVPDKHGILKFDPGEIAAMLYLYKHGNGMPTQVKRQVREIAGEEFKKVSKDLEKKAREQGKNIEEVALEEFQRLQNSNPTA